MLRAGGWVALYDHYFIGEMVDVPEFAEWSRRALERFPLPARNHQVGDPRGATPAGFEKVGDEFYADDIEMTQQQFVDYQLSISNFVAAAERGAPVDSLREWVIETTAPFYASAPVRTVRFLGSLTCLRPTVGVAQRPPSSLPADSAYRPARSVCSSRRTRRSGLPPALRGISATSRSSRGSFAADSWSRPNARRSSSDGGEPSSAGTTYATTRSPHSSSGAPTMHTSRIVGMV